MSGQLFRRHRRRRRRSVHIFVFLSYDFRI